MQDLHSQGMLVIRWIRGLQATRSARMAGISFTACLASRQSPVTTREASLEKVARIRQDNDLEKAHRLVTRAGSPGKFPEPRDQ
jgi:hypothetical protein